MRNDEEAIARVIGVLVKHFPAQLEYQLRTEAMRIYLPIQVGSAAEYTQEWSDFMLGEMEKVERMAANLREVEAIFDQIRPDTASHIAAALATIGPLQPAPRNRKILCEILKSDLAKIRGTIEAAALGLSAGRNITKRKAGGKRKDIATMVAWTAGISFRDLSSERPTVRTKWDDSSAYGPFLALIADIFEALEIDASAEGCARKAAKSIKEGIHPVSGQSLPLALFR